MICIDLRRDLAKAAPDKVTPSEACQYTQPCSIGAMMSPEERQLLADKGQNTIAVGALLIGVPGIDIPHLIDAPKDQHDDLLELQEAFDSGEAAIYAEVHTKLSEKYA